MNKNLNNIYKDYLLLYQILKKENKKVKLIYNNEDTPKLILIENNINYNLIIDKNDNISIINKKLQNKTFLIHLNYLYKTIKKIKISIDKYYVNN